MLQKHKLILRGDESKDRLCISKESFDCNTIIIEEDAIEIAYPKDGKNIIWSLTKKIANGKKLNEVNNAELCSLKVKNIPPVEKCELRKAAIKTGLKKNKLITIYNIVARNAYYISDFILINKRGLGLFPNISLLNHSCNPNCILIFKGNIGVVMTIRGIKQGEELTLSYNYKMNNNIPKKLRCHMIGQDFNFSCQCSCCLSENGPLWNVDEESMFMVINKSEFGENFLRLGNVIWKTKSEIFDNQTLFHYFSVMYIKSFLMDGVDYQEADFIENLCKEGIELIKKEDGVESNYFVWYANFIYSLIINVGWFDKTKKNSEIERIVDIILTNDKQSSEIFNS